MAEGLGHMSEREDIYIEHKVKPSKINHNLNRKEHIIFRRLRKF